MRQDRSSRLPVSLRDGRGSSRDSTFWRVATRLPSQHVTSAAVAEYLSSPYLVCFAGNMFPPRICTETRRPLRLRSRCLTLVTLLLAAVGAGGCGSKSSPDDKATAAVRTLVGAFAKGDARQVCESLSDVGKADLTGAAAFQGVKGKTLTGEKGCEAAAQFFHDHTPAADRQLAVSGKPTDVDIKADGATVNWEGCCSFELEEVGGDYVVSDPSPLNKSIAGLMDAIHATGG